MKKSIIYFIILVGFTQVKAQSIQGITMQPASPNDNDSITFYVDLMFPYYTVGNSITMQSLPNIYSTGNYCMGMLTVIHNFTDTVKIAPLAAGTYNYIYTLYAGYGGPPCSPPFTYNDMDTLSFAVSGTTEITSHEKSNAFFFPNPSTGEITFSFESEFGNELYIQNSLGKTIQNRLLSTSPIKLELDPGTYFLRNYSGSWCKKLIVIQ